MKLTIPKFKDMYLLKSLLGILSVSLASALLLYFVLRKAIAPGVDVSVMIVAISICFILLGILMWPATYVLMRQEGRQKAYLASQPKLASIPATQSKVFLMFWNGTFQRTTKAWSEELLKDISTFMHIEYLDKKEFARPIQIITEKDDNGIYYYLIFERLLTAKELELWDMFRVGFLSGWRR